MYFDIIKILILFHRLFVAKVPHIKLECAASNGNRYPQYPQVMATAISQ